MIEVGSLVIVGEYCYLRTDMYKNGFIDRMISPMSIMIVCGIFHVDKIEQNVIARS